jgi:hypothetical protein
MVCFNSADEVEHTDCEPDETRAEEVVEWNVKVHEMEMTNAAMGLENEEGSVVIPLQRPACPGCFIELPVSMVCGYC